MLELYFVKLCINLLIRGTLLSDLSDEELEKIFTIKHSGNYDINTIDVMTKEALDALIMKYGISLSVIKADLLLEDAKDLKCKITSCEKANIPKTSSGIDLFILGIERVYEKLEKIYMPEVLVHLYLYLGKKSTGVADIDYFVDHILDEKIQRTSLISYERELEDQILLPGFEQEIEEDSKGALYPVVNGVKTRQKLTKDMVKKITDLFSVQEVNEAIVELVDALNDSGIEAYVHFSQTLLKATGLFKEIPSQIKSDEQTIFNL